MPPKKDDKKKAPAKSGGGGGKAKKKASCAPRSPAPRLCTGHTAWPPAVCAALTAPAVWGGGQGATASCRAGPRAAPAWSTGPLAAALPAGPPHPRACHRS